MENQKLRKNNSVYIFGTFLFPSLENKPKDLAVYEKMFKNWEKRNLKFTNFDTILVPINPRKIHWSLIQVDLANKTMTYYDSLRWDGKEYMTLLSHFFGEYLSRQEEGKLSTTLSTIKTVDNNHARNVIDLGSEGEFSSSDNYQYENESENNGWIFKVAEDIPKQNGTWDCGVYLCKFMDYISRKEKINFTQNDMDYFRKLIGVELLEGKLINS
jgi:sentrin-specific protease 1